VIAPPDARACTTPTTKANRHHAVRSSTAAQVSASAPSLVLCILRSVRIRASTGNAVTAIEIPMNNANAVNGTSLVERIG
jgi:hypothetical protein